MEALEKIASLDSVEPLFNLFFQNDRLPLRDHVIMALAAIANKFVETDVFEKAFSDTNSDSDAKKNAIAYLATLLDEGAGSAELNKEIEARPHSDDRASARCGSRLVQSVVTLVLAGKIEPLYPNILRKTMNPDCLRWIVGLCGKFSARLSTSWGKLIQHEDGEVRRGVLLTADVSSIPRSSLLGALQDSNIHVRTAAYRAVGQAKLEDVVPTLLDKFMTGNEEEIASIIDALGQMPETSLEPLGKIIDGVYRPEKNSGSSSNTGKCQGFVV